MQDFLGNPLEVGDYIFGGDSPRLYIISEIGTEGFANVTELGARTPRRVFLNKFVKISKEQLTLYFMQKGYKT
jgi:hypothetical protein